MGSEITDDTVEPLAFAVCNTDGVEGLSWAEVEQCEVSKNKYCISENSVRRNYSFLNLVLYTVTFGTLKCGNYSREETIQGQKLFTEIQ